MTLHSIEKFPSRDSISALTICKHAPSVAENSPGVAYISGSPEYFLSLAKDLRLHLKTFELAPAPGVLMSVFKSLGVNNPEKYQGSVNLTDTHPSDEDTPKDFLNRKTEVHLGNRFKGGKSSGDIGA